MGCSTARGSLSPQLSPTGVRSNRDAICAPSGLQGRTGKVAVPLFPSPHACRAADKFPKTAHPPYDLVIRRIVLCAGFRFILPAEQAGFQGAPCPVFYGYEAKCAPCARARCAQQDRMEICPFALKAIEPVRRMAGKCVHTARITLCAGLFRAQKRGLWDCDDGHAGQNRQSACADAHERSHVYACFRRACA